MYTNIKPFHGRYPGLPDLYHTYCSECPDYGICAELDTAQHDARMHELEHAQ